MASPRNPTVRHERLNSNALLQQARADTGRKVRRYDDEDYDNTHRMSWRGWAAIVGLMALIAGSALLLFQLRPQTAQAPGEAARWIGAATGDSDGVNAGAAAAAEVSGKDDVPANIYDAWDREGQIAEARNLAARAKAADAAAAVRAERGQDRSISGAVPAMDDAVLP